MTMKASSRQVEGVTIVDLSGRITLDEGSVVLRDTVKDLYAQGHKRILLNLGDVTYIDSSGVGELVSAFTSIRNAGGELKLLNSPRRCTICCRSPNSTPCLTFRTTRLRPSAPSVSPRLNPTTGGSQCRLFTPETRKVYPEKQPGVLSPAVISSMHQR